MKLVFDFFRFCTYGFLLLYWHSFISSNCDAGFLHRVCCSRRSIPPRSWDMVRRRPTAGSPAKQRRTHSVAHIGPLLRPFFFFRPFYFFFFFPLIQGLNCMGQCSIGTESISFYCAADRKKYLVQRLRLAMRTHADLCRLGRRSDRWRER